MLQRVLYVDDDEALTELVELVLEAADIEVLTCASGYDAVAQAPQFAPDLILLDREMPELDGLATLAALRKISQLADVPIVFVTAESDPAEHAVLLGAGGARVLAKPIDPATLAASLRTLYEVLRS